MMRRILWLSLGVSLWVVLAIGCAPVTPPGPPPEQPPQVQETDGPEPPGGWELPTPVWEQMEDPASSYISEGTIVSHTIEPGEGHGSPATAVTLYVDDQVLVSGTPDRIETVIGETNERMGERLEAGLHMRSEGDSVGIGPGGFEFRRYHFTPADRTETTVLDVVQDLREASADQGQLVLSDANYFVTAKANCLTDVGSPLGAEASSGHGEASPGHGEASPLHGAGRPFPYPDPPPPPNEYFWQQWALDVNGNGIDVADGGQRRTVVPDGEGVQIIVLDTSPFGTSGQAWFTGTGAILPELTLTVEHPFPIGLMYEGSGLECLHDDIDISDHGLFVAGLAHAVAPASNIKLVRVLGDDGAGDLGGILYALLNVLRTPSESPTVLNLSLGVASDPPSPACAQKSLGPFENLEELIAWYEGLEPDDRLTQLDCLDTASLQLVVQEFGRTENVLIAAAAGNHAHPGEIRPAAQLPARYAMQPPVGAAYSFLLAVAASTSTRDVAFYSHVGNIGAPGGGDNDAGCEKAWVVGEGAIEDCWHAPEDFVVSITATKDTGVLTYSLGYWMGTSFATPLVAGMAAGLFPTFSTAQDTADEVLATASACPAPSGGTTELGAGIICFP